MRRLLRLSCDLRIQALQRGQSVNVYLFHCPFPCISWSIVLLLDFLMLVCDVNSCYVMVILDFCLD